MKLVKSHRNGRYCPINAVVGVLLIAGLSLYGCAKMNLRNAQPDEIAANTSKIVVTGQPGIEFQAPLLTQEHWQMDMGGEDALSYRLSGHSDAVDKPVQYRLDVDSEYRARKSAAYIEVRFADGTTRPIVNLKHEAERCQEFNSLQSGCTFRDRFSFPLSAEELAAFVEKGLQARLVGKAGDLQKIELPPSYIRGYLKAVNSKS